MFDEWFGLRRAIGVPYSRRLYVALGRAIRQARDDAKHLLGLSEGSRWQRVSWMTLAVWMDSGGEISSRCVRTLPIDF
jgi:hypothetical protein